ncbi:unnamed protein product [Cyclocybe aegerita]|uniref:Fungal lipase-type domain-containing protein n=1 Tax=Cyclocybe aegerita TaxID=1973307 RepID=A0A8S0WLU7_CYCAE|nr:unnamed protein product [Cyclocybe aegerita]
MHSFYYVLYSVVAFNWLKVAAFPISVLLEPLPRAITGIDQSTFDDLVRYTKYSSAAYQNNCVRPLSNTLVQEFSKGGTQALIARDDARKEIVLAFRGTQSVLDGIKDALIIRKSLSKVSGLTDIGGATAHTGFMSAYNVVAADVLKAIKAQVAARPTCTVVVTGHSLGGAVATFAAIVIKSALPNAKVKLYTYGQPKVGNGDFAAYVERKLGVNNIFRVVHTNDGVSLILVRLTGYRHFGTEYWNFKDPATPANMKKCVGGEDSTCSRSERPSIIFINEAHKTYFGINVASTSNRFCVA